MLLYGGLGVDKTHTIIALQQLVESLGNGIVVCARTGSAAANIPHGQTMYSFVRILGESFRYDYGRQTTTHVPFKAGCCTNHISREEYFSDRRGFDVRTH